MKMYSLYSVKKYLRESDFFLVNVEIEREKCQQESVAWR